MQQCRSGVTNNPAGAASWGARRSTLTWKASRSASTTRPEARITSNRGGFVMKVGFAVASILIASSGASFAQEAGDSGEGLQEVVVTAQQRAENLQSVPVSVTALTSTQLASLKLDDAS